MIKKVVKTRAFKDRLKGHKDGVITLFSPDGPSSGWLYSASKDGCIRSKLIKWKIIAWNLVDRLIIIKHLLSRDPNIKYEDSENVENYFENKEEIEEWKPKPPVKKGLVD